jgi:hypothetical protein
MTVGRVSSSFELDGVRFPMINALNRRSCPLPGISIVAAARPSVKLSKV